MTLQRPDPSEHDPYYGLYTGQAPDGDILLSMANELDATLAMLSGIGLEHETFCYAEGKWSVREVVGHLIDTEWTFAYRGLCFARADPAKLPGFDQDLWARTSNAGERPLEELLATFASARRSSLAIFSAFGPADWARVGMASGCRFSVRTMPYILTGHEIHHRKVLAERYLA